MKNKYSTLDDLLNKLEGQKCLYIEQIPAFRSFGEDIIEKLKIRTGQDEERVWISIKNKQINSGLILNIYRPNKQFPLLMSFQNWSKNWNFYSKWKDQKK